MPAMSPRTQQLQAGMSAGPDQEAQLFEQGFSEMAYNLLSSRMPDVMQDVVTFKILDTDLDKGSGTGAFVVLRAGSPIYIPVILVNNAVKPLKIFYHKALNVFLPLTKGWLDEIDKNSITALGGGVKTPETLYTDVDIRNVVVPPITGRFSYASWMPAALIDVARVCSRENLEAVEKLAGEDVLILPSFIEQIPNRAKVAFAAVLKKHPGVMKHAAATYGVSRLTAALRPRLEKVAAKQLTGGALWIADKDTTPSAFHRVFGDRAGEAYSGVKLKGYAAKDTRKDRNAVVQEQPFASWTEPRDPGVYILFDTTGKERPAFVMSNPVDVFDEGGMYTRKPQIPASTPRADRVYPQGRPSEDDYRLRRSYGAHAYLAVFSDGSYANFDKLVGRPSVADEMTGPLHKRMFVDVDGAPRVGKGFFVRQKGTTFEATVPLEIKSISTDSEGVRRLKVMNAAGWDERTIATDPRSAYGSIWMPKGADIVYMPTDFLWVPLKERKSDKEFYRSALDLQACVSSALGAVGAKKVAIKDAGARQFSIDGSRALSRIDALKKLAYEQRVSVEDAEALLTKTAAEHRVDAWIVSGPQLVYAAAKLAADDEKKDKKSDSDKPKKKSPPSGDAGGGGGGGDMGGDPGMDPALGEEAAMAAMAPPAPPPPSPLDLAAMEMDQHIQQEEQKLLEKRQTIMMLLQRSQEIAGGAPTAPSVQTQAMGAPPSSMNLATGGPGMPPGMTAGMGGGMDPSMGSPVPQDSMNPPMDPAMGGDPSMGGMPPGGDPSMGGMPPGGGMNPSMGGMPPGGDPSMGGQPPMGGMPLGGGMPPGGGMGMGGQPQMPSAMMPPDGPNAQSLDMEVNPQFLDQAAQLHSADMFDAAAVASLAQSPALHGIVAQYLPNLEKAVDNLSRVLLTLWMQEYDLKAQIGETTFTGLEENLQATLETLGGLVLRLSRGVQALKEPDEHAA